MHRQIVGILKKNIAFNRQKITIALLCAFGAPNEQKKRTWSRRNDSILLVRKLMKFSIQINHKMTTIFLIDAYIYIWRKINKYEIP